MAAVRGFFPRSACGAVCTCGGKVTLRCNLKLSEYTLSASPRRQPPACRPHRADRVTTLNTPPGESRVQRDAVHGFHPARPRRHRRLCRGVKPTAVRAGETFTVVRATLFSFHWLINLADAVQKHQGAALQPADSPALALQQLHCFTHSPLAFHCFDTHVCSSKPRCAVHATVAARRKSRWRSGTARVLLCCPDRLIS